MTYKNVFVDFRGYADSMDVSTYCAAHADDHAPTASFTHFFVKLDLAAPASFFSAAAALQVGPSAQALAVMNRTEAAKALMSLRFMLSPFLGEGHASDDATARIVPFRCDGQVSGMTPDATGCNNCLATTYPRSHRLTMWITSAQHGEPTAQATPSHGSS